MPEAALLVSPFLLSFSGGCTCVAWPTEPRKSCRKQEYPQPGPLPTKPLVHVLALVRVESMWRRMCEYGVKMAVAWGTCYYIQLLSARRVCGVSSQDTESVVAR